MGIKVKKNSKADGSEGKKPQEKEARKPGKGEGNKDSEHEENVISSSEFDELEKKEGKSIKLKKASKEDEKEESPKSSSGKESGGTSMDMLLLKTEKLEGKLDAAAQSRGALEERLSGLNQEIGELRSSIMEKDKLIREFQGGFTRIKETAEAMEPEKVASRFAKLEEGIEKNEAGLEKVGMQMQEARKEVKDISEILENVRDVKNLVKLIKTLQEKVDKVEEHRKYASRTAAKIESMFSDMSSRLAEFQSFKDKISFNEETMHELMKSADMLETRMGGLVKKDDFKNFQTSIEDKISGVETKTDDKIYEMKDIMSDLLKSLKEAGLKGLLEEVGKSKVDKMFATREEVDSLRESLEELRKAASSTAEEKVRDFAKASQEAQESRERSSFADVPRASAKGTARQVRKESVPVAPSKKGEQSVDGIREGIDSIIERAEESIKGNDMDEAKNLYRKALSMYNQLNRAESYQEAGEIYERIRKLYSRLRVYT